MTRGSVGHRTGRPVYKPPHPEGPAVAGRHAERPARLVIGAVAAAVVLVLTAAVTVVELRRRGNDKPAAATAAALDQGAPATAARPANAAANPFYIIFDLAMGGGFPAAFGGGPNTGTVSGGQMKIDYVVVYNSKN